MKRPHYLCATTLCLFATLLPGCKDSDDKQTAAPGAAQTVAPADLFPDFHAGAEYADGPAVDFFPVVPVPPDVKKVVPAVESLTEEAPAEATPAGEAEVKNAETEDEETEAAGEAKDGPGLYTQAERVGAQGLVTTPAPHRIFEHWQQVFDKACTPQQLCLLREGESATEDQLNEVEEVRAKVHAAMEAAKELYRARVAIVEGPTTHPDYCEDEEDAAGVLGTCRELIAEGFRRDLEALATIGGWVNLEDIEPSMRPGNQSLLMRPTQEALAFAMMDGDTAEISRKTAAVNSAWWQRQNAFMEEHLAAYTEPAPHTQEMNRRDPFTGMCWLLGIDGKVRPETVEHIAGMRAAILREARAWGHYTSAMAELVCPSYDWRGSGAGIMCNMYESHLLDSRERFICLLTLGLDKADAVNHLAVEQQAELHRLHMDYPFGETFTSMATLFRHPRLEGHPWCIRFPDAGEGFIFVPEGEALTQYTAAHPEGGKVQVKGYQSIESVGKPYRRRTLLDRSCYERIKTPVPEDALKLRQVFCLLSCVPEEEAVPEEEYEGEADGPEEAVEAAQEEEAEAGTEAEEGEPEEE